MKKVRILQLGSTDFSTRYALGPEAVWFYEPDLSEAPEKDFDMAILDRCVTEAEAEVLYHRVRAHCLFCLKDVKPDAPTQWIIASKCGRPIVREELETFLREEPQYYFPKPYGEKVKIEEVAVAQGFKGSVKWNGFSDVTLNGDYGEDFNQILYMRYNVPMSQDSYTDFWLEYKKDPGIEIALRITEFAPGSVSGVERETIISEAELQNVVALNNPKCNTFAFVSLLARGKGTFRFVALHTRLSRNGRGCFLPGGQRVVTSDREEAFFYFDPADMKPPLNVYFSGYKTQEGFEGYNMMRNLGCPFLLVSEARLEGGGFYMGSPEYESMIARQLEHYISLLGFTREQVIFSGLSMGTYGALYYGCSVRPHMILLGKPLASIGNVAHNEKTIRPGGFPTSLDVLHKHTGAMDGAAVQALNDRFWDRFDRTDWGQTTFAAAYMIEDDYDSDAYQTLISHLKDDGVQVIGKGLHGRHNDNTGGIVDWFITQYFTAVREDFGRAE